MIVQGEGRIGSKWAIVGEAPGEEEARQDRPFVGRTGQEQDRHLQRNGLNRKHGYLTNLVKLYREGNPSPSPADVAEWGPRLITELRKVGPRVVLSAGHHSTRYLLGYDSSLDAVHGFPQVPRQELRDTGMVVVPSYHPAAAFYDQDLLQFIHYDYARFAAAVRGEAPSPAVDLYPEPIYVNLSLEINPLATLDEFLLDWYPDVAIDTEGVPSDPWSFQISTQPGRSLVVLRHSGVFDLAVKRLRRHFRKGGTAVFHNAMYDVEMMAVMGLDCLSLPMFDSMMAAYLMCLEPQSLKALARRWCGMEMKEYEEVIGDVARQRQLEYLERVMDGDWPDVEARVVHENDGTARIYKPKHIGKVAEAILIDVYAGKETKEGPADPLRRWRKVDPIQRRLVEKAQG